MPGAPLGWVVGLTDWFTFQVRTARVSTARAAPVHSAEPGAAAEGNPSLDALQRRLHDGDSEAFEAIFRRLSAPVYRFVCGMVQDEALAHDLTQDTFAKLWSIRDRVDAVESLRAYVFQMARHRVYNQQRDERTRRANREQLRGQRSEADGSVAPDEAADAEMLQAMLRRWIDDLPDRQREVLTLRRQENLSHDEIASILDIAPSTVNNHLVRAMKHLRRRLREHRPHLLD